MRMSIYFLIGSCVASEVVLGFHAYGSGRIAMAIGRSRPCSTVMCAARRRSRYLHSIPRPHRRTVPARQLACRGLAFGFAPPCAVKTANRHLRVSTLCGAGVAPPFESVALPSGAAESIPEPFAFSPARREDPSPGIKSLVFAHSVTGIPRGEWPHEDSLLFIDREIDPWSGGLLCT